jgi:hypothetical protein
LIDTIKNTNELVEVVDNNIAYNSDFYYTLKIKSTINDLEKDISTKVFNIKKNYNTLLINNIDNISSYFA